jgi:putative ABC transport system ATP-binding protein
MVTHEPDVAAFTKRNVVFRDGLIISDRLVDKPLDASAMRMRQ